MTFCFSVTAANGSVTLAPGPTQAPPPLPAPGRCSRGQFLCRRPPHCIPDWQRCDGQLHCQDGSDEAHCRESLNTVTQPLVMVRCFVCDSEHLIQIQNIK